MQDVETESKWVHLTGTCMEGEHKGKQLDVIPSTITDWKTWKEAYPETDAVIMSRTIPGYVSSKYEDGRQYAVALKSGSKAKAWRYDYLKDQPLLNDELGGIKLVILFDAESGAAWGYDRLLDDQVLSFIRQEGQIIDEQTLSTWDLTKGLATDGKLKGKHLKALPMLITLTRAWEAFHEDSLWWPDNEGISKFDFER